MIAKLHFQNRTMMVADGVMEKTIALANRAASTPLAVLIVGESGTGKELIARYIHEKSKRSRSPFVSVNCAAIPEGLMEAELFGYEKGAFTGALFQRVGKFEKADAGTLLLDEISEMSTALQAKLLRVLQEGEVDRLGGKDPIRIDTRVIATTNKDPLQLIAEGHFREDLFYRLNVIRIECQPLRNRPHAVEVLAEEFLRQSSIKQEKEGLLFAPDTMEKLCTYSWPGNIRELQNAVDRAVLLADGKAIAPEHFDSLNRRPSHRSDIQKVSDGNSQLLSELEESHILKVLEGSSGNRTHAAKKLGISVRTLRNKLKEYQVG